MEILNQFGFDLKLFAAQIVNFLVIAFIFKKFLYKPILTTLNKRKSIIKKGLKDAEEAERTNNEAQVQKDSILATAGKEAERILAEAQIQAKIERDNIMDDTKKEIAQMMEATKEQILLERENFKKESKDLSLELSRMLLESTISKLFDKKEQDIIMKKGISQIKNDTKTKN